MFDDEDESSDDDSVKSKTLRKGRAPLCLFLCGVSSEATGVPPIAEVTVVVTDGVTDGVTVVLTDGVTDGVTGEVTAVVSNGVTDGVTDVYVVTGEMIMEVLMAHLGALDGTGHFDGDFSILSFLLYLHLEATESFAALFSNFSIRWFKAIENNHNYNCINENIMWLV